MSANKYLLKVAANGEISRIPFEADNSYNLLSGAVGGYIEIVPCSTAKGHDLYCNEEGKLEGLPINEVLTRFYRKTARTTDFIVGDGVFAASDVEGKTQGLTAEECDEIVGELK